MGNSSIGGMYGVYNVCSICVMYGVWLFWWAVWGIALLVGCMGYCSIGGLHGP